MLISIKMVVRSIILLQWGRYVLNAFFIQLDSVHSNIIFLTCSFTTLYLLVSVGIWRFRSLMAYRWWILKKIVAHAQHRFTELRCFICIAFYLQSSCLFSLMSYSKQGSIAQCFPNCVPLKRLKWATNVLCFVKTFCMLHHFRYKVCEE